MNLGTIGVQEDSLHAELSRLLADDTTTFWTLADRLAYLNQAYREVNDLERPVSKYVGTPVAPLVAGVAMPADFLALAPGGLSWEFDAQQGTVYVLQRRGDPELDLIANGWQTASADTGTPAYYRLEPNNPSNNTATLVPSPVKSGTLRISYVVSPAPLAIAADVPWGGSFAAHHRVIAARAEVFARQREQNAELEKLARDRYGELLGMFKRAIGEFAPQATPFVRSSAYRRDLSSGRY